MQKIIGGILTIGGLIALIYTLINYINNTSSFQFLGAEVVVSEADITPVIVSAIVMVVGLIIWSISTKR
ncbi:MAG TPA: hypothetical protein VK106_00855 [Balneolaceae bacterium]|nr:hypothetical protein [Balneolaceae bacterium]